MSCVCLINNGYPHLSFLNKHPINRLSVSVAVLLTSGPEHQNDAAGGYLFDKCNPDEFE